MSQEEQKFYVKHGNHSGADDTLLQILNQISAINVTLAGQKVILEEHVRRTNLLEAQMKPLEAHMNMMNGALKLIGAASTIAGIIELVHLAMKWLG